MTLLKPTISLNKLAIFKDKNLVFDAIFHGGVNIIRGHNSSGKTTILDFIAYTLGAEYIPWKQEALLCDWSILEVSLNGKPITLRRPVNDKPLNPLYVYWGPFDAANQASATEWEVFGFRRSESKISFTQALLLALDLPEAKGDGASNLTMHQLLRVLYADQPSLHSPIFRSDAFDSSLNRETIGSYLSGVYEDGLYVAQLEKKALEKNAQQLDYELKSIFNVLAKSEQRADIDFLGQEINHFEKEREKALTKLNRVKQDRITETDEVGQDYTDSLRSHLDIAKRTLALAQDKASMLELDIADSKKFVEELWLRLHALDDSSATRSYFGRLAFAFCPCCLSEIEKQPDESKLCSLCKNPLDAVAGDSQVLRMRNELRIQLNESQALITEQQADLDSVKNTLPELKHQMKVLEQRYTESSQTWSSDVENVIENTARQIGAFEEKIKGLYENQRLAENIRQLQERRDEINHRIMQLDSIIESSIYTQETRKRKVQIEVASTLGRLLRHDLNRQAEFQRAENIHFSFTDNMVSVEGSTQFSESSTVVLRHLFHLALLSASTRISEMRLPRFLILDGIEDGGMELERSYRLQEIIVNECSQFPCDYQVIFATSQIAPSLENDTYVVGRQFSEDSRSLQIARNAGSDLALQ